MGKDFDFIKEEHAHLDKIFTDISYGIDEISPFMEESQLVKRKFYSKYFVLRDYMNMLKTAEVTQGSKGFFNFFNSNPEIHKLEIYKRDNAEAFRDLEQCSKCKCLTCIRDCSFKNCVNCSSRAHIKSCDKERINLRVFDNFILDLDNNSTGEASRYKVLGVLEDCTKNQEYIVIQNIQDINDKYILYYKQGIKDASYEEITNEDEFNFVAEAFEKGDL